MCQRVRRTAVQFVICSTYISLLWTDYVFSFLSIRLINDQSDSRKRGLSKPTQFMPGLKKVKHCRHPVDLPRRSNHEKGEKTIQFQP